ncbi:unnamed protein product [Urochloa decumbens]|uniref:Germin-like protein n=1 Tax=Urochloa decumbens TaxID=240449 RepID=A0ABC9BHV1_9POAL
MAKAAVLFLLVLLPFSSDALKVQDFCIANLLLPSTPAGYPCKPRALATANDFYFRGLASPGPTVPPKGKPLPPFNAALASAYVAQFPALNGLGIGATRVDIARGSVVPLHAHPEGSEILFVLEGTLSAGFVGAETNAAYTKTLNKGDLFVFPQGLLHYQYNLGNATAVVFSAYSSSDPGLQVTDFALFANLLPADVVSKVTFITEAEVMRLKRFFGIRSLPTGQPI